MTRFDCMIGSSAGMRRAVARGDRPLPPAQGLRRAADRSADHARRARRSRDRGRGVAGADAAHRPRARSSRRPHEDALVRLGSALGKYWICKRAPQHAYEAMECIGGSGVMEDLPMPRLYREAPVNAIWEGSGNVQCLDVLRAIQSSPDDAGGLFRRGRARREARARALDAHVAGAEGRSARPQRFRGARARSLRPAGARACRRAALCRAAPGRSPTPSAARGSRAAARTITARCRAESTRRRS